MLFAVVYELLCRFMHFFQLSLRSIVATSLNAVNG